jgi:glycosyltransferase involved in cell wall biosynthesis
VTRDVLIEEYANADILFLHLNDYDAFEKVLPSKIFEYAAMGKPIWAGVSGFAAKFIDAEVSNSVVFYPCNVGSAMEALSRLDIKDNPRPEFLRKFSRARIMDAMASDILSIARKDI